MSAFGTYGPEHAVNAVDRATISSDKIAIIHSILNSDDLAIGVSTEDPSRPYTIAGAGEKARMTRKLAEAILRAMEKDWGHDAPEAIVLRGLLNPLPAEEGGAS